MSSKLTEITESPPSALPPSVICGSGVFNQLSSPSIASFGHFDPSQTYDGYRAVEVLDPACTECLAKVTGSRQRDVARWTDVGGPIPVGGRPIYSSSEVSISRINTEGVVKRIRRIADSPADPDSEGSDELDGEEVEVVPHLAGHPSSNSSAQPLPKIFQSQVIPSTPKPSNQCLLPCQACLESSSKTITKPATQELTHNHLTTTPTCGQFQ
ncbi:hypothetical protein O181_127987 [Austropuccinia psidii MF-1]|uniref:Uncharacterized protein n=1 Tax=Austropuccinia psidii MF-1 TaxID=1389203 RepID=A0A9Q3KYZ1_9BASI|nr:hypothetical protein [Austropuccinia psidii MF-1]